MNGKLEWNNLKWKEIENYLDSNNRIIIPVGSVEQHGPHLPVCTDWYIANEISKCVSRKSGVLVAPPLCYGMSMHHSSYPGTISLKPSVMISIIESIVLSLLNQGFGKILFLNAHGGNKASIQVALMNLSVKLKNIRVKIVNIWELPVIAEFLKKIFNGRNGIHGSPGETSVMLYLNPDTVRLSTSIKYDVSKVSDVLNPEEIREIFPSGLMNSDPTTASAKYGKIIVNKVIEVITKEVSNW